MSVNKKRHLHAVPEPEPTACMYADAGCGSCGGPVTNVGDGRDYCMNHGSVRIEQVREQIEHGEDSE